MAECEKIVREILKENGCYFVRRGKGDHDIWRSQITGRSFPVDSKIKSRHVANAIMRQGGVDHKFYPNAADKSSSDELFVTGVCLLSGTAKTPEEQGRVMNCVRSVLA